jgi:hypothetical protein
MTRHDLSCLQIGGGLAIDARIGRFFDAVGSFFSGGECQKV